MVVPRISSKLFKEYYWFDLYRDAKEDIPINITESRGHEVSIYRFSDADFTGDSSTRCIKTGVLIFIKNDPIHWYRKIQKTVEASTF